MKCRGHQKSGAIYSVLVDIYGQYGRFQDAEECVNALKVEGIQLSASIFCVLANALAQQRHRGNVERLWQWEGDD
ncbi:hypothetical protein RHSIM_Rhsim03G0219800 [Rhododendron simsii]|uniref:Pentatricopeptide repeat-containing protein n=1 Tax=Rhododendron simsii TaxID=118357 RepID=A0A834H5U8_RHOSS|nr:hypothetical protein RHSIM_Rhsim03G0219800 [Rhododendron simsii]